ncbi:hypothetical protein M758_1G042700 [Ceratodon purpureus]|nr:hypothetical protein M758_1G042700 [Ceratodon purpureus]
MCRSVCAHYQVFAIPIENRCPCQLNYGHREAYLHFGIMFSDISMNPSHSVNSFDTQFCNNITSYINYYLAFVGAANQY